MVENRICLSNWKKNGTITKVVNEKGTLMEKQRRGSQWNLHYIVDGQKIVL